MPTDYSKIALFRFLDTVVTKGLMNTNTAGGLKAACSRILDDVDNNEDVRKIDVNTAVIRYNNRNPGVLAPNSLAEYQRRVARSISDFIRWVEDPTAYKPLNRASTSIKKRKPDAGIEKNSIAYDKNALPTTNHGPIPTMASSLGLPLSFPLRPDFLAQVVIPRDLTVEEAKRLGAFVLTLATDFKIANFNEIK